MIMNNILKRIEKMPVPVVATTLGACTLSNVYNGLGFPIIRHITMIFGTFILLAYLYKIFKYPHAIKNDYQNTMLASLYGVITMLIMLLSSYYMTWIPAFKYLVILAVVLHACQICVFLYMYLVKKFDIIFFIPSWFVTLNGIMVSTVVALPALPAFLAKAVLIWGVFAYTLTIPFMVYRLKKFEIKPLNVHTQAILIAPCSLIVATYINMASEPNLIFLTVYYTAVVISLIFTIIKMPHFFSFKFAPQYAGLTFPMAIGIVASQKFSGLLLSLGYDFYGNLVNQIAGIQIYLTTAIISFVLFNFYKIFTSKPE